MEIKKRYSLLDSIRGFTLLNMILYHCLWNLVNIFNIELNWYNSNISYIWQQSICFTFIFISGFCFNLSSKHIKRGYILIICGILITAVTSIFSSESKIIFGILTFLGSAVFITIPINNFIKINNISYKLGLFINIFLFVIFRNVNIGYLGFYGLNIIKLPDFLYSNILTTYFGFTNYNFKSSDYFSILPWIFLYLIGYFTYNIVKENAICKKIFEFELKPFNIVGKNSLIIYLLHQPVLYFSMLFLFKIL